MVHECNPVRLAVSAEAGNRKDSVYDTTFSSTDDQWDANVKTVRGVMTDAERERLVERITDVVVEVYARGREEFRPHIWVVLEEVEPNQWGAGGKTVDLEGARRLTGHG